MSNERWVDWESLFQHACNRRSWARLSMWLMCTSWRRNTFQYWSSCMSVCAWLIAILNPCMLRQIFIVWHSDPFPFHLILTCCTESSHPLSPTRHLREQQGHRYQSWCPESCQILIGKRRNLTIVPWPHVPLSAATAIIETFTSTLLSDWWNLNRMSMTPFPLVWRIQRRELGASQSCFYLVSKEMDQANDMLECRALFSIPNHVISGSKRF